MKKKLLLAIAFIVIVGQVHSYASAAASYGGGATSIAIKKYKAGNYTGCLQDAKNIVSKDPSNAVAYYYMAMSYAQAGRKDEAIEAYKKVLSLKPNATLSGYAATGKRCLETPDKCSDSPESSDIDKAVASPFGDGLSDTVRTNLEQKHLDAIRMEINHGDDVNNYKFRQFKDYTNDRSDVKTEDKISQEKEPTNDEIVAALRTLKKAGLNPVSQNTANPYAQIANTQNPEMAQLNMLMGSNNQGNNNNNAMLNMIPYMLSQKDNQGSAYTPQMMQAMMMNSMLPDFNFNTNNDNK